MKGPYTIAVRLGGSGASNVHAVKRIAIRLMRSTTKLFGEGAQGEVREADGQLVRQVVAYTSKWGAIRLREMEL